MPGIYIDIHIYTHMYAVRIHEFMQVVSEVVQICVYIVVVGVCVCVEIYMYITYQHVRGDSR